MGSSNRRKCPRVALEAAIGVQPTLHATVVDISAGGILLQFAGLGVEIGDTLSVALTLEGQKFGVVGTVVRAAQHQDSQQEVALTFTEIDPVAVALIEDL